jgi:chromosome segregation ATPase
MDIERTMQFIVEQQAQLTASVQKHDEQIASLTDKVDALTDKVAELAVKVDSVTDLVGRVAQAELRIVERMNGHEARLQSLETKMTQFLDRMDRFLQGQQGDGHKLQ